MDHVEYFLLFLHMHTYTLFPFMMLFTKTSFQNLLELVIALQIRKSKNVIFHSLTENNFEVYIFQHAFTSRPTHFQMYSSAQIKGKDISSTSCHNFCIFVEWELFALGLLWNVNIWVCCPISLFCLLSPPFIMFLREMYFESYVNQ